MNPLRTLLVLSTVVAGLLMPGSANADNFWLWRHRMKVTFQGYALPGGGAETLTNFPALVILSTNTTDFSYSQFASGSGGDLRFQNSNETVVLSHEIDLWNTNGSSFVWVQVPSISTSNDYIWAYWGSPETNPPAYTTNGSVWSDSYAGVWHLTESSFPYVDSTAGEHDGTSGVLPGYTNSGVIGPAQVFNGTSQKIDVPYASSLNTAVYTVSCWANVAGGDGSFRSPVTSRNDPIQGGYICYASDLNKWGFWQGTSSSWASVTGTNVINGAWAYVAGSYDGSNMRLFVNGVPYGPQTAVFNLNSSKPLRIGAGATEGAGTYWFNGIVDEVRVENVVRSTNWLWSCMMNQGSNGTFNLYGNIETRVRGTVMLVY